MTGRGTGSGPPPRSIASPGASKAAATPPPGLQRGEADWSAVIAIRPVISAACGRSVARSATVASIPGRNVAWRPARSSATALTRTTVSIRVQPWPSVSTSSRAAGPNVSVSPSTQASRSTGSASTIRHGSSFVPVPSTSTAAPAASAMRSRRVSNSAGIATGWSRTTPCQCSATAPSGSCRKRPMSSVGTSGCPAGGASPSSARTASPAGPRRSRTSSATSPRTTPPASATASGVDRSSVSCWWLPIVTLSAATTIVGRCCSSSATPARSVSTRTAGGPASSMRIDPPSGRLPSTSCSARRGRATAAPAPRSTVHRSASARTTASAPTATLRPTDGVSRVWPRSP